MYLRLRQLALVAGDLAPLEAALCDIFALQPCFRDPAVAEFGLVNVLLPVGAQFVEIVQPIRPGTAAGRYLERRDGDGGYMVITQCADHEARRARVATLGVRIAHTFTAPGFLNMQLHPRDTGGSFFEIDQQLGEGAEAPDGPWLPAGPHWHAQVATTRVAGIVAAEIQCAQPRSVVERWAAIAELPFDGDDTAWRLALDNAELRFVPCRDGRPEGLAGIDLAARDAPAVLGAAANRGLAISDGGFTLGGMRWRVV